MNFSQLVVWHAVPTLCLCGLIWMVQLVHYPLFAQVGTEQLVAYERAHSARITPLVMPLMLLELAATVWMCLQAPPSMRLFAWLGAGLLAIVWGSTFFLQVPCHRVLEHQADPAAIRQLVATNWLRTIAWTARGAIAVGLLFRSR